VAFVVTDVGRDSPPTADEIAQERRADRRAGFLSILDPSDAKITPPGISKAPAAGPRWRTGSQPRQSARHPRHRESCLQYHFGRGLVATSKRLRPLGGKAEPSELLDWLAHEFVATLEPEWLHRTIMNSATYLQTTRTRPSEAAWKKDPDNRWLWRMKSAPP